MIKRLINKLKKVLLIAVKNIRIFIFSTMNLDINSGVRIKTELYNLERLGTKYGGWTVPDNVLDKKSICYLVGAGEDISFDVEIAKKYGSKVYIFDPTPRAVKHFELLKKTAMTGEILSINSSSTDFYQIDEPTLSNIHFLPWGIWKENGIQKFYAPKNPNFVSHAIIKTQNLDTYFEAECKTVTTIMKELGHSKIDLIKLDVEGAEHEIINSIIESGANIKVICIEFDEVNFNNWSSFVKIRNSIKKLLKNGYDLVYVDNGDYTFIKK